MFNSVGCLTYYILWLLILKDGDFYDLIQSGQSLNLPYLINIKMCEERKKNYYLFTKMSLVKLGGLEIMVWNNHCSKTERGYCLPNLEAHLA